MLVRQRPLLPLHKTTETDPSGWSAVMELLVTKVQSLCSRKSSAYSESRVASPLATSPSSPRDCFIIDVLPEPNNNAAPKTAEVASNNFRTPSKTQSDDCWDEDPVWLENDSGFCCLM